MQRLGRVVVSLFLAGLCSSLFAADEEYRDRSRHFFMSISTSKMPEWWWRGRRRRTKILAAGKLGNDAGDRVDGDTVFEIGSVTKTFTAYYCWMLPSAAK